MLQVNLTLSEAHGVPIVINSQKSWFEMRILRVGVEPQVWILAKE